MCRSCNKGRPGWRLENFELPQETEAFETFQPTCFWDWARGYIGKANQFYLGTGPNDPQRVVVRLLNVQRSCNSLKYKTYWIWPNVTMYLYIQLSKSERFYCRPEEYQTDHISFLQSPMGAPKKAFALYGIAINICKSIHIQLNTKNILLLFRNTLTQYLQRSPNIWPGCLLFLTTTIPFLNDFN